MILIDKSSPVQNLILTLSESTTIESAKYLMVVTSDSNREEFRLHLPENTSPSTERYDLFQMETDVFTSFEPGYYTFSIYQYAPDLTSINESALGCVIEVGKLYVRPINVNEDNQYIIYAI